MGKRSRKGPPLVALLVTALAFAVVAVLLWRVRRPQSTIAPSRTAVTEPVTNGERLSETERRSLKEILKRKGAGAQK